MKNGFDEKVKGHGFFRKTKAFGLASGIVLGATLIFGAGSASADEATPTQPATVGTVTNQGATIPTTPPTETKTVAELQTPDQIVKLKEAVDDAMKNLTVDVLNTGLDRLEEAYNKIRNEQLELKKTHSDVEILPELTVEKPKIVKSDISFGYNHDSLNFNADGTFTIDKNDQSILKIGANSFLPAKVTLPSDVEKKFVDYYNFATRIKNYKDADSLKAYSLKDIVTYIGFDDSYRGMANAMPYGNDIVDLKGLRATRIIRALFTDHDQTKPKYPQGVMSLQYIVYAAPVMKNGSEIAKGSVMQKFVSVDGKVLGEKTTGSVPMGSKVTLTHEKTITLDGKTYTFTRQDVADPTEVTDKDVVVTYTYTEQNLTPVDPNAGKPIVDTIIKEYKPNPKLDPGTQNIIDPGKPRKTQGDKVVDPGKPQVIEVGTKPKVVEEEIPFEKKTRENPNLPEGTSKVVQEGKNGKKKTTTTYTLDPKTGKVTPNTPTVETTPPVDQITEIGKGKDKDGDLVVNYIPDPESPQGNETVVDEGKKPKLDVTGKVKDPGKPKVIKVGTKPKVVEEEIPFEKKTRENPNLPEGTSKVVQEGKNGKKKTTTTYTLDPKTGKVTPNTPTVETTPPVDQITEIGKGKDKDGDLVVNYIPDPESPQGNETIVDEGSKPKLDVTGKVKDPGKPKVIKVGTKPKVVEEEIPFEKKTRENPNLPEGTSKVVQEGKNGKKKTTTTYTLDPKTGKVTPNTPTVETTPPVDQITEIGKGKDKDGDLVVNYIPDPESPQGKETIVDEGSKPKLDVTGKVKDPGKPKVIKVGTKPKVVEEEIPFEKKTRENPNLPEGTSKVVQEGKNGKKKTTTTYTLDPKTGKVTPNTPTVETTPPVDQITEIGKGKDKDGDLVVNYIPDPESPEGNETIVDEGSKPKLDITGKVKDPGKPKVIKVGTKPKVTEEEIPFKETVVENPSKPEGSRTVLKEGKVGKKTTTTTYTLDPKTGKVTPNTTTSTTPPEDRLIEVGTGKNVDGDIVTEYVPDLELEPGQTKVVQNGTPEVKDVTGKVVTPGTPTIIHIGIKPKVVEENVPFEREYKDNPKLPEGVENVIQKGVNGKKVTTTTYTVDTKTGKVTSTDKVDETPVVNEIVERGTGKNITGEIVVNYVPDPELEPGKTKVVQNGTPEVKDVTGKVVTPGKPTIIHVGTKPKVVEEETPFKEETRENKDLPKGQTKVVQEGKVGKKTTTTTYEVDPKTGTVTPTEKVEETPAVNKITEIGTKEEAKPTPTPASQTPAKPQVQEVKKQLPSTGSATSVALTLAGLSVMGLATTMVLKKKEQ